MTCTPDISPLPPLLGKTPDELKQIAKQLDLPAFVGGQIAQWLYKSEIKSFDGMTNISKKNQELLKNHFQLGICKPISEQTSVDGTKKYLFPTQSGKFIETAYIPDGERHTLCVSSQVGCKMGCLFCMTGKQGFQSQLTAGEIINQLRSIPEYSLITNLVFMGMGEPFDNFEEVMRALEILTADWGFGKSVRKVTVSTLGIVPAIEQYLKRSKCNLAISLHSPFDEERQRLMPIQKVYPIKDVIKTIRLHHTDRYRKVSIEYIVFQDLNHSAAHVKELARLLNKLNCRINLIRFHNVEGVPLQGANDESVLRFQKMLIEKGIVTTIRTSRGLDIAAACGLLSTKKLLSLKN